VILGVFGIMHVYKSEKRNKNISPSTLYIVVHNNHVYDITESERSLQKKLQYVWEPNNDVEKELKMDLSLPSNYLLKKCDPDIFTHVRHIKKLDDVLVDLKTVCDDNNTIRKYIFNEDLIDIVKQMIYTKPSYIPEVNFSNGRIISVRFKINGIIGTIEGATDNGNDKYVELNENNYKKYHVANNAFYNEIFKNKHMSIYNPNNVALEKQYKMVPQSGILLKDAVDKEYDGIDCRKAYTSDLLDIEYFPVYSYFDVWKNYDGHSIEDYNQYIVECLSDDPTVVLLFPDQYTRVTGYKLNRIKNVDYKILHFKRPSKLIESTSKNAIDTLYKTKIDDDESSDIQFKKDIVNINIGLLGKKYNKRTISKVFKDYDEAFYYSCLIGAQIKDITSDDCENKSDQRVFLIEKNFETELIDGFMPIKEMIYDIRSLKNYSASVKLMNNGIRPVSIKTDCILFEKKHTKKVCSLFDMSDKIGCFKIEKDKGLCGKFIQVEENDKPSITEYEWTEHTVKNERDKDEINKILKKQNTLILGELPGVGKTYTSCQYEGKKIVSSPYTRLCFAMKKKGLQSMTIHKLLGLGMHDQPNVKLSEFNCKDIDCIIFDEICLAPPDMLFKISQFMKKHPEIRFIATGDCNQIEPIGFEAYNNIHGKRGDYLYDCLKIVFPDMIKLKECKRLKNKKDIDRLVGLKKDILDPTKPIFKTFKKYNVKVITDMKDLMTTTNLSHTRKNRECVNKYVLENLIDIPEKKVMIDSNLYWVGMNLVCHKRYHANDFDLFIGTEYKIKKITSKMVTLHEEIDNITFDISRKLLSKLNYEYCLTVHSVQGCTIENDYTIFDCDSSLVSRNWIYTAVSRTDDINKITVFQNSDDDEYVDKSIRYQIKKYLIRKCDGYKAQDTKAKREYNDDSFVDADWINKQFMKSGSCGVCKVPYEVNYENDAVVSNITVDRIDCSKPHHRSNCRLMCMDCNKARSNKAKN
jgi:hypothetical protein